MASPQIVHLTDDTFDDTIKHAKGPVLVDFFADWCGPCKVIAPLLDQIADEMAGVATVAKVNVDENGDVSSRFGIQSIPTMIVFKDGRIVDQTVGALPKEHIKKLISKHVA